MEVQGKDAEIKGYILLINGAPGRIRTCDLRIRSPLLYPAELQALFYSQDSSSIKIVPHCLTNRKFKLLNRLY